MTYRIFGAGVGGDTPVPLSHVREGDFVILPNTWDGGGPIVVVCHGAGATHATYAPSSMRPALNLLAEWGCCVVIPDLGGTNTWGTDTAVHATTGRIREAIDYAVRDWDADGERVGLIGHSMGFMNAIGFHWRAPSVVAATVGVLPVCAADALHDRTPAGLGLLIDTAYGSLANWEADKGNRDPSAVGPAALIAAFKDNVRLYYSTNDTTVLQSDITTFCTATGVAARPIGAIGHSDLATASVDKYEQGRWLASKLGLIS